MECVLAEILHEMSFLGYCQEDMEAEREKLLEATREIAEGKHYSTEEVFAKLTEEFGWERPEPDPEEELEQAIHAADYTV